MGKTLITIGIVIVALGVVLTVFPKAFSWFGRLPGDVRVERESGAFYFPITTMILISVALTVLANLLSRK